MPTPDIAPTPSNDLSAQLAQAQSALAETKAALAAAERKSAIESELLKANTIDLETASILADRAIAQADSNPAAVAKAVAEIKQRKPFLFRAPASPSNPISSAAMNGDAPRTVDSFAHDARSSGDRRALLRYLRAKRGG